MPHALPSPANRPAEPLELWVDGAALPGGDGGSAAPLKALPARLESSMHVKVRSGLYRGPFELNGAHLEGVGEAVLFLEGPGTVLTANGGTVEHLSLQGGELGALITGPTTLSAVHFSGHRLAAASVRSTGQLSATACVFEASVTGSDGVTSDGGVTLSGATFRGAYRRAIDNQGGVLRAEGLDVESAGIGVRSIGGSARLERSSFKLGRGAAVLVAQGALSFAELDVMGHEYALQAGEGARVTGVGLTSRRAQQGGVSAMNATLDASRLRIDDSGGAAVLVSGGTAVLDGLVVHGAVGLGLLARVTNLTLKSATFEGIRRESNGDGTFGLGDAVHLRDTKATLGEVIARDVDGSGLFASASARVTLRHLTVERAGFGGVVAELGADVRGDTLEVSGGREAAIVAPSGASVDLKLLRVAGALQPVWADCAAGAKVHVVTLASSSDAPLGPCVTVDTTTKPTR